MTQVEAQTIDNTPSFDSARPLLSVKDLTTEFRLEDRTIRAVDGVSFDVAAGEMFGIVGETGCGKSATIRTLLGLIRPPGHVLGGEAWFEGQDLLSLSGSGRRRILGSAIGFVAQNPWGSLNPVMRISRQFDDRLRTHTSLDRGARRARAIQLLGLVEIGDVDRVLDGYSHELSGGMAQRVVIALALACEPRMVVADEPTTALDVTVQAEILDLLAGLSHDKGFSTLLVTHDLGVVAQYCSSVAVMYAARAVETGSTSDVLSAPKHPYTSGLVRAIPQPGQPLTFLGGRVPDLGVEHIGCSFAPRCAWTNDHCRREVPPLAAIEGRWSSACHRSLEIQEELK